MARRTTRSTTFARRAVRHDRHGRSERSAATGPHLDPLKNRIDTFDMTVAAAADFLRSAWPDDLANVRYEVGAMPLGILPDGTVPRWWTSASERRIVLYRLPIQRMSKLHRDDELHQRMMIESCVFRATAELIGKDPWDLGPDRFHF
ncbi:metallopeptidase family protein [Mycetocola sp.]|uniref:metallopeptidase family protein n=1 Tax=Mycetocola sp. TaxID=1871042 RepID=UPI003989ED16